jgi:hypothetical protein
MRVAICALLGACLAGAALGLPPPRAPRPARVPVVHAPQKRPSPPRGREETGIGFAVGPIGGIGFAYRRFREDGAGWQIGGLAYADRDDYTFIVGAQRMHTLRLHERSRLYALAGAMHIRDRERYDALTAIPLRGAPPVYESRTRDDSSTRFGAGIGMSFGGGDGLSVAVELPLVAHFDEDFELDGVGPIPQLALIYNY